jgi:hypothetical protein
MTPPRAAVPPIVRRTVLARARSVALLGALLLTLVPPAAMAIEEPAFRVLESAPPFEIREYAPYVVAQTTVAGEFERVGNEGFRRLFDYITGANRNAERISMTAPVEQQAAGERIAMTAPVTQQAEGGRWRIAFVLPSSFTLATAPQPTNPEVELSAVAARRVAVIRYSGTWSEARYREHLAELEAFLGARRLVAVGAPVYARFDPPFMPWFLRRNEIQQEVRAP